MIRRQLSRRDFIAYGLASVGALAVPALFAENDKIKLPFAEFRKKDKYILVKTNSKPSHITGVFPNAADPYGIGEEVSEYKISSNPTFAKKPIDVYDRYCRFGVAVNGVIFDPAGPAWDEGWYIEVLSPNASKYLGIDMNNAHVQPYDRPGGYLEGGGEYHYHGFPSNLYGELTKNGDATSHILLGYAADGFAIYAPIFASKGRSGKATTTLLRSSYRLKTGEREAIGKEKRVPAGEYDGTFTADYEYVNGYGDLDEFNGRFGVTPEYPNGAYYYVVTFEFPFVSRKLRGEVIDDRFFHKKAPGKEQTPKELASIPAKK